jgi:ribosomal protein S12 methylthiotransferase
VSSASPTPSGRIPADQPSDDVTEPALRKVSLVTLGCARNEVDSEELAGRLGAGGWELVDEGADVVVVNTCGFIDAAKKDSIDTLLAAADTGAKVVATGCLAERYGEELANSLPEADAVLGFDHYATITDRLDDVLAGRAVAPHQPRDRRTLLPISPVQRGGHAVSLPGHGQRSQPDARPLPNGVAAGPHVLRRRLEGGPVASLKIASGCDRRCSFCAIPSFRGAFVSRQPEEVLAEAEWLAGQGVREMVLVSENSTSYGKDLGDVRALEKLLPQLAAIPGVLRLRVAYLQPAELRPGLLEAIATTPGVAPYFDLSFQHSSAAVLRRMRRFGDTDRFLALLEQVRSLAPAAGARTNVILGFPGETRADVAELERFLAAARLDAVGVFGYSDEDGTEAETLDGKVAEDVLSRRVAWMSRYVDELLSQRAEERLGETVEVLVESIEDGVAEGRAAHQGPEDGTTTLTGDAVLAGGIRIGDLVRAEVTATEGVDLVAEIAEVAVPVGASRP